MLEIDGLAYSIIRAAHVASVQYDSFLSRSVTISDEEFDRYQVFQQFQVTQMISSSSTITLPQTSNFIACFSSTVPSTYVIDSETSNHMTENKYILSTLNSVHPLLPVTLVDASTSYTENAGLLKLHHLYHSLLFFIYLNSCLICCLLADSLNL